MELGRVMWFNQNKGVGYIEHDDGRSVYFHDTSVLDRKILLGLARGVRVMFDLFSTREGWEASNVIMLRE